MNKLIGRTGHRLCTFATSIREIKYYFNIWGIRKEKKEGGSEKGGGGWKFTYFTSPGSAPDIILISYLCQGHLSTLDTFSCPGREFTHFTLFFTPYNIATIPQPQSMATKMLTWENSQHLAMLLLVSPPNDVWEKSAEIPYWWCLTTQIWVALLIGWIKFPTWHNQSEAFTPIWVVLRHQYGISVLVCQTSFGGETSGSIAKWWLFSQATKMHLLLLRKAPSSN